MSNIFIIDVRRFASTLFNNQGARAEVDWYTQNGSLQQTDIVVAVDGDKLLIYADGVQVASVPERQDFLRSGRY